MKKIVVLSIFMLIGLLAMLSVPGCGPGEADPDEIVLRVNEREITKAEYEQRLNDQKEMMADYLQQMPEEQRPMMEQQMEMSLREQLKTHLVLLEVARERGLEVTEEDIDEFIDQQQLAPGEFEQILEHFNVTEEELRDDLREDVLIQKLIDQGTADEQVEVTDEAVEEYYQQHQHQMAGPDGEVPPLEEIEEQIRLEIESQQQQQLINQFIDPLLEDAEVEENWPERDFDQLSFPQ